MRGVQQGTRRERQAEGEGRGRAKPGPSDPARGTAQREEGQSVSLEGGARAPTAALQGREGKGRSEGLCLVSCHKNSAQGISENHGMHLATLRNIFKSILCQNLSPV